MSSKPLVRSDIVDPSMPVVKVKLGLARKLKSKQHPHRP